MKAQLLALWVALCFVAGCAVFKDTVRTITDIAIEACKLTEASQVAAERAGLDVEQFCRRAEIVKPFVDEILAAQARAGVKAGIVVDVPEAE